MRSSTATVGVSDSDGADVLGLRALGALGDVELHLLALGELAVSAAGDGRVMGEHVRAAPFLLDEAESLFAVEPLHGAGRHAALLNDCVGGPRDLLFL